MLKSLVAVTIVRLPQNANHATAQVNRTTWASAELLTASFVANAPALYTLCKRKGGPNPPQLRQHAPPKNSKNKFSKTSTGSGPASSQYELQTGHNFEAYGYSDGERGGKDPDRESQVGILVTSNINTEYLPKAAPT